MITRAVLTISGLLLVAGPPSAQQVGQAQSPAVAEEMVQAAQALLANIGADPRRQRMLGIAKDEILQLSFEDERKRDWSYWPRPRTGLKMEQMDATQRTLAHDLLSTLLSSEGQLKVMHIMELEEILASLEEVGLHRGAEDYYLTFFGTPSVTSPWAWKFEGHHVSLTTTVTPVGLTVTPSFFGADPAEVRVGWKAGFRPLRNEDDLARQLVTSLSDAQRTRAIISPQPPRDIFSSNMRRDPSEWDSWRATLHPEGIAVADLTAAQRARVQRIIDEIVSRYRPEISSAYLESIDIDELSFAWMGSTERRAPHYYRLQGGDFVFEFDMTQDDGNHIHSVWRSIANDFGDDLLGDHYRLSHR